MDSGWERLWTKAPSYEISGLQSVSDQLRQRFGLAIQDFFAEPALSRIQDHVADELARLPHDAPFPRSMNGDFALARLCYALCRAARPLRLVETGVCYGVTTAFILQALKENEQGSLFSIDLPPLGKGADDFVGKLVPQGLRSRWTLRRGTSRSLLPELLTEVDRVDFFLHDSLHSYRNMRRELMALISYLSPTAMVLSDDIERNCAFAEWVSRAKPAYWAVLPQHNKPSLLGMAIFSEMSKATARPSTEIATS